MNLYSVILSLFILCGLAVTAWGWWIIVKSRRTLSWPSVEGRIEESQARSEADDLLPLIVFSYQVAGQSYSQTLEFPPGLTPTEEFSASYVKKYPKHSPVQVHYDPENPAVATLEPGLAKGEWFVLAMGIGTTLFGILFLFF